MTAVAVTQSVSPSATPAKQASAVLRIAVDQIYLLPAATASEKRLTLAEIRRFLDDPRNHQPFVPVSPVGLDDLSSLLPADNPMTRAKVELGRQLYFDARLSRDSTISCATCHDPAKGWAEHTSVSTGIGGQKGARSAPTVLNRAISRHQFWDGRAESLEAQALGPIQNPIEMGFTLPEVVSRLKGIEGYRIQFERVFGDVSADGIAKSIAAFERTVLAGGSPFDYYVRALPYQKLTAEELAEDPDLAKLAAVAQKAAKEHPMSESAIRGRALFFGKANCSLCHVGANLTDESFYNIGVGMTAPNPDLGRSGVTKKESDAGAFKTPTVRNITLTAPYMHDGSQKTLAEVVDFYDKGGHGNPQLHSRIKKLNLTAEEKGELVAFMESLTGTLPNIPVPRLP
jgi:cytochrome c peroxidase